MFRLDDKIIAVTGAGSGIGAAIAELFAQAGATVYLLEKDESSGEAAARQIVAEGGSARFIACDVTDQRSCGSAAAAIHEAHGRCDVLVNNAGIGHVGTTLTTTGEDFDRLVAVNIKGVLFMTQALIGRMIERRSGCIINMASIGGIVAVRDRLAYCATKFAVVGMTKCMALDHADAGIRVNCICPGRVATPFVEARLREYPDPKKAYDEMTSTQLLRRMASPVEIAAAALYLASDESSFVTGSSLIIDAGWTAGK
jgi:NAD(P)-dependent dehydrogenase (short-subunit alcohol dehydrogenase family)